METMIPLTIKIMIDKRSKDAPYVAYTPELDIASCGPNIQKAKKNLSEAVGIILKGAAEDGNLKDLLLDAGFEINKNTIKPPLVSFDTLNFSLDSDLSKQIWLA